jgi:hypothetical protein
MVINWKDSITGIRWSFHLDVVTTLRCFYDGTVPASPPPCNPTTNPNCFNTITGEGEGSLIGRSSGGQIVGGGKSCPTSAFPPYCGLVDFKFTDRGEPNLGGPRTTPGMFDDGEFSVTDLSARLGNPVAVVSACACVRANYQAHVAQ